MGLLALTSIEPQAHSHLMCPVGRVIETGNNIPDCCYIWQNGRWSTERDNTYGWITIRSWKPATGLNNWFLRYTVRCHCPGKDQSQTLPLRDGLMSMKKRHPCPWVTSEPHTHRWLGYQSGRSCLGCNHQPTQQWSKDPHLFQQFNQIDCVVGLASQDGTVPVPRLDHQTSLGRTKQFKEDINIGSIQRGTASRSISKGTPQRVRINFDGSFWREFAKLRRFNVPVISSWSLPSQWSHLVEIPHFQWKLCQKVSLAFCVECSWIWRCQWVTWPRKIHFTRNDATDKTVKHATSSERRKGTPTITCDF